MDWMQVAYNALPPQWQAVVGAARDAVWKGVSAADKALVNASTDLTEAENAWLEMAAQMPAIEADEGDLAQVRAELEASKAGLDAQRTTLESWRRDLIAIDGFVRAALNGQNPFAAVLVNGQHDLAGQVALENDYSAARVGDSGQPGVSGLGLGPVVIVAVAAAAIVIAIAVQRVVAQITESKRTLAHLADRQAAELQRRRDTAQARFDEATASGNSDAANEATAEMQALDAKLYALSTGAIAAVKAEAGGMGLGTVITVLAIAGAAIYLLPKLLAARGPAKA